MTGYSGERLLDKYSRSVKDAAWMRLVGPSESDLQMVTRIPTGENTFLLNGVTFYRCKEKNGLFCKSY